MGPIEILFHLYKFQCEQHCGSLSTWEHLQQRRVYQKRGYQKLLNKKDTIFKFIYKLCYYLIALITSYVTLILNSTFVEKYHQQSFNVLSTLMKVR